MQRNLTPSPISCRIHTNKRKVNYIQFIVVNYGVLLSQLHSVSLKFVCFALKQKTKTIKIYSFRRYNVKGRREPQRVPHTLI